MEPNRKPKIRPVHISRYALNETFLKPFTPRKLYPDHLKIASIEKERKVLNDTFHVSLLEDGLTAKERDEVFSEATKLSAQFKTLSLENEDSASITAELFNFSPLETSLLDVESNKENCFAYPQLELTRIVQSPTTAQNEIKNNAYDLEEEKVDDSDRKLPDLQSTFDKSNPETPFLETKEPDKTVMISKPGPVKTFVKPKPKVEKSQSMREPFKNLNQKPQIKKPATATGITRKIIAQSVKSVNTTPAKRMPAILPAPRFTSTPNIVSNGYVNLKNNGVASHLVKKSNPTQRSVLSNIPAPNNIIKKNIFTHKESKLVAPAIKRSRIMF